MEKFTNPNVASTEMEYYTYEEFTKFISVEDDIRFKSIFETLYFCGLLRGELRGLSWDNINFKDKTLSVVKNVVNGNGNGAYWKVTTPKTKKSIRSIPISKHLADDLSKYKEECKKLYGFNEDYYVFGFTDPIGNETTYRENKKLAQLANIKKIRIHDFRHSYASFLINNNATITLVAYYLEHTKIDKKLNTYSHMYKNSLESIVNIMDNLD